MIEDYSCSYTLATSVGKFTVYVIQLAYSFTLPLEAFVREVFMILLAIIVCRHSLGIFLMSSKDNLSIEENKNK